MKWIFLKTVSFEIGSWLTGGFTFLFWSVRSKHRTIDHKNETITANFWGSQHTVRGSGRTGQRVLGKMVWTFSVHTAIVIKKGSVINVICYERVCYERVCYEHGLLWVACYERVCLEWEPFWSIVIFLWVTSFKLFTVIGFSAKAPSYWRWWWQLHMLQKFDLKNKNVNYTKWFWSFQDEWKA